MGVANGIETLSMIQMLKRDQRPRPSRWSGTCHPFYSSFKYSAHFTQDFIDKRLIHVGMGSAKTIRLTNNLTTQLELITSETYYSRQTSALMVHMVYETTEIDRKKDE